MHAAPAPARARQVMSRMAYEKDPATFASESSAETEKLRAQLLQARERVKSVTMPRELTLKISEMCSLLNVDGLRGDIVTNRSAKALAALEGRSEATLEDIKRVAPMCLSHRMRKDVMDSMDNGSKARRPARPARPARHARHAPGFSCV